MIHRLSRYSLEVLQASYYSDLYEQDKPTCPICSQVIFPRQLMFPGATEYYHTTCLLGTHRVHEIHRILTERAR